LIKFKFAVATYNWVYNVHGNSALHCKKISSIFSTF